MSQKLCKLYIPRLMALLLCVTVLLTCAPAVRAEGQSGYCGKDLYWTLTGGTLTITGSGPMNDYSTPDSVPWSAVKEEIVRLDLPAGLIAIGSHAFYGCKNLLTVTVPDTVATIGTFAFMNCSAMEYLDLGGGVADIGEYAFFGCLQLQALSLPGSLRYIGNRAFYRCASIPSVTVPAGVTHLGNAAFGYCESLICADIQARISVIPEYLFYGCSQLSSISLPPTASSVSTYSFGGCDRLSSVYYEDLKSSSPAVVVPSASGTAPSVIEGTIPDYVSSETSGTDSNGLPTTSSSGVVGDENITISSSTQTSGNDASVDISVTVREDTDWEIVQMYVQSAMNESNCNPTSTGSNDTANLNIYVADGVTVDSGFLDAVDKQGINVNITTQSGSVWKPIASTDEMSEEALDLSYEITAGSEALNREMDAVYSFLLRFASTVERPVTVEISLGSNWAYQSATLFCRDGETLVRLQSVMADGNGCAAFSLASVSDDVEYVIGMNLPFSGPEEAPDIPQSMLTQSDGIESYAAPVQYEITGRKSSWNMGLGQVMGILAAVMIGAVALVGFIMYLWNKQRLKSGYTPDWDEDDE